MSMLNWVRTNSTDPLKELELHLGGVPIGIYWPTKELHEYITADVKTQYGIDVEADAMNQICEQLMADWPPYAVNKGMTRLELTVAFSAHLKRSRQRPPTWSNQPAIVQLLDRDRTAG